MASLEIEHLEKSFGANRVVKDFNLSIEEGEFISLLGPSGCGKTTVLRMVAGFESPSGGAIRIGGQDVTHLGANQRNIGMVFQAYALFPNLTVAQNVGFGMRVAKRPRAEIKARVAEMLELIGLPDLGNRYPFQLSGGNSSVWRWRARSRSSRACCCSTSRFPRLMRRSASPCAKKSATFSAASASPRSS